MQAFFMNATFLSSGTASVADAVATPGNVPAGNQDNGVFQALLASQTAQSMSGSVAPQPVSNNFQKNFIGRVDLPVDLGTAPEPGLSNALAGLQPPTQNIAEQLGTVFTQLRNQLSEIRNGLPAASGQTPQPTINVQSTANAGINTAQVPQPGVLTTAGAGAAATLTVQPAGTQTDTRLLDQSMQTDPLIAMLEPMREQLAALGIDIDTLGTRIPDAATQTRLKSATPVQDTLITAAPKAAVQVQDTLIPATPPTASPEQAPDLTKTLSPEPARPEAALTPRTSLIERIADSLEGLKENLGELQLPPTLMQGLENTISQLNAVSQLAGMGSVQLPDQVITSLAIQGTPLAPPLMAPTQSAPPNTHQANTPPVADPSAQPDNLPTTEKPSGVSKQAAPDQTADAKSASAGPAEAKAASVLSADAKLPAFSAPPVNASVATQASNPATSPAASTAPAAPAVPREAAPELAAAAQQARPTSAPGAQLADRNNKVASVQAPAGSAGNRSNAQASPSSAAPQTQPSVTQTAPTAAEAVLQDNRIAASLPGQAGFEAQLAQPQTTGEQNLGLRTDQDLTLQRADGRSAAERPTHEGQRFTPQSAQQLAAQITRRFANGNRVFDIRLDPAELGRVDVRLELSQDQRVQAILTVERPETLAELQRSARDLERALNEAGLELENDGLEFQLDENADDQGFNADDDPDVLPVFVESDELELAALANESAIERDAYGFRLAASRDRLDMRI